jgi:predicted RNA-binding protein with PUA-like domain
MVMFRKSRLSVVPVTDEEFAAVVELGGQRAGAR